MRWGNKIVSGFYLSTHYPLCFSLNSCSPLLLPHLCFEIYKLMCSLVYASYWLICYCQNSRKHLAITTKFRINSEPITKHLQTLLHYAFAPVALCTIISVVVTRAANNNYFHCWLILLINMPLFFSPIATSLISSFCLKPKDSFIVIDDKEKRQILTFKIYVYQSKRFFNQFWK